MNNIFQTIYIWKIEHKYGHCRGKCAYNISPPSLLQMGIFPPFWSPAKCTAGNRSWNNNNPPPFLHIVALSASLQHIKGGSVGTDRPTPTSANKKAKWTVSWDFTRESFPRKNLKIRYRRNIFVVSISLLQWLVGKMHYFLPFDKCCMLSMWQPVMTFSRMVNWAQCGESENSPILTAQTNSFVQCHKYKIQLSCSNITPQKIRVAKSTNVQPHNKFV